jgi:Flp pilus assembly protein TadG
MLRKLKATIQNGTAGFAQDHQGNFAVASALLAPLMVLSAGFAVNIAHLHNTRSSMTQALDVALTSTTRDVISKGMSKQAATVSMENYLAANGNVGLSEANRLQLTELDIDRTSRTVTAQLKSDVRMPFALFGMAATYPVTVDAKTGYTDRPIEVAMMLDLTGSMNETGTPLANGKKQTKLDNLRTAATQAVGDLLGRNAPGMAPRVRVALIPYSQGVNTGDLSDANYVEDASGRISDAPIGLDELDLAKNKLVKAILKLLKPLNDDCTTERKRASGSGTVIDLSDDAPGDAMVNRDDRLGKNTCPRSTVVPLTADADKLLDEIKRFNGVGATAGHIGVQWTRYLLSPKWSGFLRQEAGNQAAPAPYSNSPTAVRKVAILLTDGEFNTQFAEGGSSASFAKAHCEAMKANVEVFTIGFMLDDRDARATMQACASPDVAGAVRHYYEASNAQELQAAFRAITANTEVVRLTD